MADNTRGNLIVLYGVNNMGKTTQAKMLVESLILHFSKQAEYIKYPIYTIEPSGTLINSYIKQGNPNKLTPREFQLLHVLNRTQHQADLRKKLEKGTWIVAEDYIGSGIAWGMAEGIKKDFLYTINSHLIQEDLGILFTGKPFAEQIDKNNIHETNTDLTNKANQAFDQLSKEFSWHQIKADQDKQAVQQEILNIIKSKLAVIE